jgi:aspartyl-tRNA synthetase
MYRTFTCGELNLSHKGTSVVLSGWIQRIRNKGSLVWIDLRDRYGITQLVFEEGRTAGNVFEQLKSLGREFVIQVEGVVVEREAKNTKIASGEIEIDVHVLQVLNASETPPFTIEDHTDGGDELRMQYRYLDLRRNTVRQNIILRHKISGETRNYLNNNSFLEIETPYLIKSTPEGARDFVVPSRMNQGQFYALPQSPQTFKQLLMVAGFDRYYQIVRCFRDEDLRADRQPEFTQIDCEMSFIQQEDILNMFEGLVVHLFKTVKGIEIKHLPRMTYNDAMTHYGCDKPDIRFDMKFVDMTDIVRNKGFVVFDNSQYIAGIVAKGCGEYTRKQLDELTEFVKKPQIGASGLVYVKLNNDGSIKSSVDKFFDEQQLRVWAQKCNAEQGDLILVLAGGVDKTRKALSELRLEMGTRLGLRNSEHFAPLWVVDFPMFEWDEESRRFYAKHHPFTSPKPEHIDLLDSNPAEVLANAYDMVINGVEVGGGSIRIHDQYLQKKIFSILGFSDEEAQHQFGFLMNAFKYGAPPHGGLAFGFDRLCSLFGGSETIRDFIAFPKNNAGRDVMIDSPSTISEIQLNELSIELKRNNEK